jgi:GntR family transcriptional regulator
MTEIETPRSQYVQIADIIRHRIEQGIYAAGSLLPSEDHLAGELGVSRVTINRAVGLLRSAGDVRVRRGTGAVVRSMPRILRNANTRYAARNQGTGAGEVEVRKLNLQSRTDYGEIGRTTPPVDVARALGIRRNEAALVRRRVFYADDQPTQIADSYYPWSLVKGCPQLHEPDTGTGGSLARLTEIGYPPLRYSEDIDVRMPTPEEQHKLDLDTTQPVFRIWHVAYTHDRRPIEVCIHVMPGHLWTLRYEWDEQPVAVPVPQ